MLTVMNPLYGFSRVRLLRQIMLVGCLFLSHSGLYAADEVASLLSKAAEQLSAGEAAAAIATYSRVIDNKPDNLAEVYALRGRANLELGNDVAAMTDYDKAIALNPKEASASLGRARLKSLRGDSRGALEDYSHAITHGNAQFQVMAYYHRGNLHVQQGDTQAALRDWNKVIELRPMFSDAYFSRGKLLAEKGKLDEAIKDMSRVIGMNTRDLNAIYNRGLYKIRNKDMTGAIADFDRAIAINPSFGNAYLQRAMAKEGQGNKQGAAADYAQAQALGATTK